MTKVQEFHKMKESVSSPNEDEDSDCLEDAQLLLERKVEATEPTKAEEQTELNASESEQLIPSSGSASNKQRPSHLKLDIEGSQMNRQSQSFPKSNGRNSNELSVNISNSTATPACGVFTVKGTPKPIKVGVFLIEGEGRILTVERGKATSAGEIMNLMMQVLSLPEKTKHLFSIWMISKHLELQLKDHHLPYLLRKQWVQVLDNFAEGINREDILEDEPVIVFKRNSFLSVEHERKIKDDLVIKRLFEEARFNILKERYPVSNSDAEKLAGLLMVIDNGKYDPETYKQTQFKNCLENYVPPRLQGRPIFKFVTSSSLESRLLIQYQHASEKFVSQMESKKEFLGICQEYPFYGCAFFKGFVEGEQSRFMPWRSGSDYAVYVGINRSGVTLFKENRREVMFHLLYDQLSWDYSKADEDLDTVDSFCLEYDISSTDSSASQNTPCEQIHIMSRQACMMDAMVESCVHFMNRLNIPKTPTTADHFRLMELGVPLSSNALNFTLSNPFKFHTKT